MAAPSWEKSGETSPSPALAECPHFYESHLWKRSHQPYRCQGPDPARAAQPCAWQAGSNPRDPIFWGNTILSRQPATAPCPTLALRALVTVNENFEIGTKPRWAAHPLGTSHPLDHDTCVSVPQPSLEQGPRHRELCRHGNCPHPGPQN